MCRRGILLFSLISLLWVSGAEASCSGSGTTWNCPAGTTSADLATGLSNAADGATLTFAPGAYTWDTTFVSFDNAKGVTLICATQGACNVAMSGTLGMNGNLSGLNNKLYRISGFNFNISAAANYVVWFYGPGTLARLRIDHNNFNAPDGATVMYFGPGDNSFTATFYGVIDHNNFSSSGSISTLIYAGALNPTPPPSPAGTANNLFFEDNTIAITTMTNADRTCVDGWGNNNLVLRHNTSTNCVWASHGATHSGGPANIEFYNNSITVNAQAEPNY